jgi:hypothetical protein
MMEMANNIKTFIGVRDGQDLLGSLEEVFSGSSSWLYRILYFRQGLPVHIIRNPVVETLGACRTGSELFVKSVHG